MGRYAVETPESVELSFELAGPGSRFCALLIDSLFLWLFVFVVLVISGCAGFPIIDMLDEAGESGVDAWVGAIIVVSIAVVFFGYYTFFELILRGQSPGKRSLKIRVIREDGTAASAIDIVVRNMIRIVDALPVFYLVGGLTALLNAQHKRLGDMAAGTIVVKEAELDYRANSDKKGGPPTAEAVLTYTALTSEERRLLRGFLQRRLELLPEARRALAERLASRLHEHHGGNMTHPEVYLERLAEGRHYDT